MNTCKKCEKKLDQKNSQLCFSCNANSSLQEFNDVMKKLKQRQIKAVHAFKERLTKNKINEIKQKITAE